MASKKAWIFRAEDQTKELREGLERIKLEVHHLPMIELKKLENLQPLFDCFDRLETIDWVVFTSANAVKYFFEAADDYGLKLYFYPNLKFATVGEKTKISLEQLGYRTNFVPIQYTAEVLAENMDDVQGKNILIPRSKLASNNYVESFEKRGAQVFAIDLYENLFVEYDKALMQQKLEEQFDYLIFTSGSTFQAFHKNLLNAAVELSEEKLISIGPSTAKIIEEAGFRVEKVADPHDVDGIISCIKTLENV